MSSIEALPVLLLHNLDPHWPPGERDAAAAEVAVLARELASQGIEVTPCAVETDDLACAVNGVDPERVVVFNWCESLPGVPHSEAFVARQLDDLGFTFTGSPAEVLARSWDKAAAKQCLRDAGVSTPDWRTFTDSDVGAWACFPAIVKPAFEHCSLGVSREAVVFDRAALAARIAWVQDRFGQAALVEDFVDGRELHVSVWGNGSLELLPPAEMDFSAFSDPCDHLCGYDSKFTPQSREWQEIQVLIPAALEPREEQILRETVLAAYRVMGCRDYARIDVRQRANTFQVLDVNPNCDLSSETSTALGAELGLGGYGVLLRNLVLLASARHPVHARRASE